MSNKPLNELAMSAPVDDAEQTNFIPSGEVDREGAMAKADLYKIANYSVKLFKKMDDNAQLEAWVQAKITKAADYIASVYHYLEYEMEFSQYGHKLDNADMMNEEQKIALKEKLSEARTMIAQLKKIQAAKLEEAKSPKAKKDYDKDGKIESEKDEVLGSRIAAAKKAGKMEESYDDDDEDPDVKKADSELKKKGIKLPKTKADPDKDMSKLAKKSKKEDELDESYDDDDEDLDVKKADSELKKRGVKLPNVKHKEVPIKKTSKDKEEELDEGGVRSTARRVVTRAISNDPDTKKALGKEGVKKNKQISRDEHKKASDADLQKVVDHARSSKKVSEASKPDFLDLDKDGNKKEPMKKAAKEKVKTESYKDRDMRKEPDLSPALRVHGSGHGAIDDDNKSRDYANSWLDDDDAVRGMKELEKVSKKKESKKESMNESDELTRMKEFLTRLNG